jgi:hypothetical protein
MDDIKIILKALMDDPLPTELVLKLPPHLLKYNEPEPKVNNIDEDLDLNMIEELQKTIANIKNGKFTIEDGLDCLERIKEGLKNHGGNI